MVVLSPEAEQAWTSLRRHLERSERFTLVLLSSDHPPSLSEVRRRLGAALQPRASWLEVLPFEALSGVGWELSLEAALESETDSVLLRAPLWLALHLHAGDEAMDRRRDKVLAALNEQRTRLERRFLRPLLIAVPRSYLPRVWAVAPDLWTIRGMVTELPAPADVEAFAQARGRLLGEPRSPSPSSLPHPPSPPMMEWHRLADRASVDPEAVSPFVAHVAVETALEQGVVDEAKEVAEQGLELARARAAADASLERQRDLALALHGVGKVALEQGRMADAQRAFAEGLQVRRELAEVSPMMLRDLAMSLLQVGHMAREQGKLADAEALFQESLEVIRRLLAEGGESPTTLRDLSMALHHMAQVERDRGCQEDAERLLAESEAVRRRIGGDA